MRATRAGGTWATRTRAGALAAALALLLVALVVGLRSDGRPDIGSGEELQALRADARLAPCPAGLGPAMPDVTVRCLGGGPAVRLRAAPPGMPTVLNVWGSWCAACTREVPDLQTVADRLAGAVAVVGVDVDDTDRAALSFAAFSGMRYAGVVDDRGRIRATFGSGVPTTVFLTADGTVAHVARGRIPSAAALEALVDEHLGVRAGG